jgi:hypothetical protein
MYTFSVKTVWSMRREFVLKLVLWLPRNNSERGWFIEIFQK